MDKTTAIKKFEERVKEGEQVWENILNKQEKEKTKEYISLMVDKVIEINNNVASEHITHEKEVSVAISLCELVKKYTNKYNITGLLDRDIITNVIIDQMKLYFIVSNIEDCLKDDAYDIEMLKDIIATDTDKSDVRFIYEMSTFISFRIEALKKTNIIFAVKEIIEDEEKRTGNKNPLSDWF